MGAVAVVADGCDQVVGIIMSRSAKQEPRVPGNKTWHVICIRSFSFRVEKEMAVLRQVEKQ